MLSAHMQQPFFGFNRILACWLVTGVVWPYTYFADNFYFASQLNLNNLNLILNRQMHLKEILCSKLYNVFVILN